MRVEAMDRPSSSSCGLTLAFKFNDRPARQSMYRNATCVDSRLLTSHFVGYGSLGEGGSLGYEDKVVTVSGRHYRHALSAHAPSRLRLPLDDRFKAFACQVALNDDVPPGRSWGDFQLRTDGQLRALANYVQVGQPPRKLEISLEGARELELVVESPRWEHCHSVWLEPMLSKDAIQASPQTIPDPLYRAELPVTIPLPRAERCIATVVSPGFEELLERMLVSLATRGGSPDALVVIFALDASADFRRIAQDHGAQIVSCRSLGALNSTMKSVLYSVARIIDARKFICLDADMLVLGELDPVFAALEVCPQGSILACREANGHGLRDLNHAVHAVYGGQPIDLDRITRGAKGEGQFGLVVNDGLFAGDQSALLALDGLLREWREAKSWVDERNDIWWRNQFVFNLALARLHCGVELDPVFNIQLNSQDVVLSGDAQEPMEARWRGRPVKILHFNGNGRQKYLDWRAQFHSRSNARTAGKI